MKILTIELPDETDEREAKMILASTLFDKGILSSGKAAKFGGISKREFLETVGKYGVSVMLCSKNKDVYLRILLRNISSEFCYH